MPWIVTDAMIEEARDRESGLSREERVSRFNDRMLEVEAGNSRYHNGRSIKETVDGATAEGRALSFRRADRLGRDYARMVERRTK